MDFEHIPVLFNETVNSLEIKPDGLYVDCTAGGGGHSHAVAQRLSDKGRLIAIDRDPEAIEVLKARFASFPNVEIVHNTFDNISAILNGRKADRNYGGSRRQLSPDRYCRARLFVSYGRAA